MPNHSHAHVSLAGESVAALLARLPWATFLFSSALGLLLQYLMASTYTGLIVESFGGARSAQVMGAGDVALAYVITLLTAGVCGVYCAKRTGPSRVIVLVHLVAVVIPLQALVAADFELARSEFAAAVGLCLLAAMALALWLDDWQLPEVSSISRMVAIVLALLLSGYVYGALVLQGGLGRISFDLNLVYEVREEYLEEAAPLFGYLVPWQGYVLNPSLLLLGFRRRSLLLMLLGLGLQVGLFAMTGFRAFLLSPIMMFGLYWVGTRRQLVPLAMLAAMAVIVISELIYTITNEPLIPSLLVYRLLLIPAELHFWYYDFFGVHAQPLLLLSQSVLSAVSEQH